MSDDPNDPLPRSGSHGSRKAAGTRKQHADAGSLREVEAERDALRARLDATHRALVEQQAADLFADPSDLRHAASIDDLRGDDGLIDPERAEATMNAVLAHKPHWRKAPDRYRMRSRSPSRPFTKG